MSFFFAAPCTMLGIPCVASFHTDLQLLGKAVNTVWIALWAAYYKEQVDTVLYDSCATTSPSFQKKLEKQGVPCEYVLGTAVDVDVFHPSKFSMEKRAELTKGHTDGLLCVFVGRLSPEKKIGFMYEVLKQVDNAYFAVIGDGLEAEKWAAEAEVPGSRMYCKPGFLTHDELAVVYASADLHVSASEFETLGNTVLESHACGTPVVVTNAQGFCNTVEHGVDGYLFKAGDAEDAIAYLTELRDDHAKLKAMGERGRQKMVEQHTVQAVVADMVEWYGKGIDNFAKKSTAHLMLACFHMVWAIALNIVLFFGYQAATGVLEQLGVISPKKDPHFHVRKQPAQLETAAAADAKEPMVQKKANGSTTKQPRSRKSKH
jgi:glycosyltransferase involved in cell wall biosynthesis